MDPATRRNMRREQVEQCPESSLSIKEWCRLNKVSRATFYNWSAVFRKEEPEVFANLSASEWFEFSREGVKAATALVPAQAKEAVPTSVKASFGNG